PAATRPRRGRSPGHSHTPRRPARAGERWTSPQPWVTSCPTDTVVSVEVSAMEIRRLGRPGDLGWVGPAHGGLYAEEFGWDTTFEALVARIVADWAGHHDPDREAAWIAEDDEGRVGCVFCMREDGETARLRILLVDPRARGHRLGARLVDQCLEF